MNDFRTAILSKLNEQVNDVFNKPNIEINYIFQIFKKKVDGNGNISVEILYNTI